MIMKMQIVDKNDDIITCKHPGEVLASDIYRVSVLWVTNPNGDILVARRGLDKKHDPGKWEPAVAGTLEEGETYETNILKEAREEIGISITQNDIRVGPKLFLGKDWIFFCQIFFYQTDQKEFTIQKEEVMEVKWFTREELLQLLKEQSDIFVQNFDIIANVLLK